mmetsp:Transcript_95389/g.291707  ORF Transcript_95389/g.291707 Transcript_95389/m.291707 type:complete len:237 (-) Transcript_95389:276-986(-)
MDLLALAARDQPPRDRLHQLRPSEPTLHGPANGVPDAVAATLPAARHGPRGEEVEDERHRHPEPRHHCDQPDDDVLNTDDWERLDRLAVDAQVPLVLKDLPPRHVAATFRHGRGDIHRATVQVRHAEAGLLAHGVLHAHPVRQQLDGPGKGDLASLALASLARLPQPSIVAGHSAPEHVGKRRARSKLREVGGNLNRLLAWVLRDVPPAHQRPIAAVPTVQADAERRVAAMPRLRP